jgi:hypothetical protein
MFSSLRRNFARPEAQHRPSVEAKHRPGVVGKQRAYALPLLGAGFAAFAVTGCGSSVGTKPSAQIRAVEVATNTVDVNSKTDDAYMLVNTAALAAAPTYGLPTEYLFVEAGGSQLSGGFPNGTPTISAGGVTKQLTLPTYVNSSNVSTVVPAPITNVNLQDGHRYTAYLCGRPDVSNPTQSDLSDLDPRYFKGALLEDNQAAPPAGSATVRVLVSAADSGNVDVLVNGSAVSAFTNVGYAPASTSPSSGDATITAGTVTVQVNAHGSGAVLVPATSVTLVSGGKYTLVVDEPTAAPSPAIPGTAPTSSTYGIDLVQN